ncbi:MAG: hypothetical protein WCJ92_06355 [Alphaproteobacteria bacterium]
MTKKYIYFTILSSIFQAFCAAQEAPYVHLLLTESRSIRLPSVWVGRDDVINATQDLQALLEKSKLTGNLPITNNTTLPISAHISGMQTEAVEIDVTIEAGQTLTTLNLLRYKAITLNAESHGFLNVNSTPGGFELSIEPTPVLLFPRSLAPFSFAPLKKNILSLGGQTREIEKYHGHIYFFEKYICKAEGIVPTALYAQRQRLYEENKLESIIERPLPATPRIPLNLFSIWLTNPTAPREPDPDLIEMAKASSRNNHRADGWNYYFLVQDPALLPRTVEALSGTDIQVVSFTDLLGPLEAQAEFDESVAECNFGKASDILRVEAITKMGGAFLDIDLQVFQSLKFYFYAYNSLFGLEPMTEFLGNAFMAASANHPVMQEIIRLIKRNFAIKKSGDRKFYSEISSYDEQNTILRTGPCVTTVAFYNAAGRGDNIDIAMPPEVLFPGKTSQRPESVLPTLEDPMNLATATLHLWKNTWIVKKL